MRFKKFITEKYLEGPRAPLYHWTSRHKLKNILELEALGVSDNWDPTKGTTSLKKGGVSFTRDKNYRINGKDSDVRFTFDPVKLQQRGYKIYKYVDRWVINNIHDEQPLPPDEARWEAEERLVGPVKLKDGLVKIEITKEAYKQYKETEKIFDDFADKDEKIAKKLKEGTFRWSIDFWRDGRPDDQIEMFLKPGGFVERAKENLAKDPKWLPKNFTAEKFEQAAKHYREDANEIREILKKVEILK